MILDTAKNVPDADGREILIDEELAKGINVIRERPPASAFIAPPSTPAPAARRMATKSIRASPLDYLRNVRNVGGVSE